MVRVLTIGRWLLLLLCASSEGRTRSTERSELAQIGTFCNSIYNYADRWDRPMSSSAGTPVFVSEDEVEAGRGEGGAGALNCGAGATGAGTIGARFSCSQSRVGPVVCKLLVITALQDRIHTSRNIRQFPQRTLFSLTKNASLAAISSGVSVWLKSYH